MPKTWIFMKRVPMFEAVAVDEEVITDVHDVSEEQLLRWHEAMEAFVAAQREMQEVVSR